MDCSRLSRSYIRLYVLKIIYLCINIELAVSTRVIFMQGNSQQLGGSNVWSLDTKTGDAQHWLSIDDLDFSSDGALCGSTYFTLGWFLKNPQDSSSRTYKLVSFRLDANNSGLHADSLQGYHYGIWCSTKNPDSIILITNPGGTGIDPLKPKMVYVEEYKYTTKEFRQLAGPIYVPENENIPEADGSFSFDGLENVWMSFSLNNFAHPNAGVLQVVDIYKNITISYYTNDGSGYFVSTAASKGQTWGVLKKFEDRHRKAKLEFVTIDISNDEKHISTKRIRDVSNAASSLGLPAKQCNSEIWTYNTDDYNWFNITVLDVETGEIKYNYDTLDLLPNQEFAFVSGFACY
eukprot:UC4_evm3s1556